MKLQAMFAALLLLILAGCKGNAPPEVAFGTAKCAACGRIIENASFASVARGADGTVSAFDRTSCLMKTVPEGDQWKVWFHDHDSQNWIEGSKAWFVIQRRGAGGPIWQVAAFPDREHASAYYEGNPGRNELAEGYSLLRAVMTH